MLELPVNMWVNLPCTGSSYLVLLQSWLVESGVGCGNLGEQGLHFPDELVWTRLMNDPTPIA